MFSRDSQSRKFKLIETYCLPCVRPISPKTLDLLPFICLDFHFHFAWREGFLMGVTPSVEEWRGPGVTCHFFIINYGEWEGACDNTQHIRGKVENERVIFLRMCCEPSSASVCRAISLIVKYILSQYCPSVFCILRIWWINMEPGREQGTNHFNLAFTLSGHKIYCSNFPRREFEHFLCFYYNFFCKNALRLDERGTTNVKDIYFSVLAFLWFSFFMICRFRSDEIQFIEAGIWLETHDTFSFT